MAHEQHALKPMPALRSEGVDCSCVRFGLEEIRHFEFQRGCELLQHLDRRVVLLAFHRGDVGAIDAC